MLNIVVPLAGNIYFDSEEYIYPKPLIEILDQPMIQYVIRMLNHIEGEKRFIFVVNADDCNKYHLDSILKILTEGNCEVIKLKGRTKGAPCSLMMAIDFIENDSELIISNGDHLIHHDLNQALSKFRNTSCVGGVICFESVHPKWSYAKLDDNESVVETAEKRPLSKNAIAGFYYFCHGKDFIQAAKQMIMKEAHIEEVYYTAPVLNELILENKKIGMYRIKTDEYLNCYSPHKIKDFENMVAIMNRPPIN